MDNLNLQIHQITSAALDEGKFARVLPEIYELTNSVENALWHNRQTVFDHVAAVLKSLEDLLRFESADHAQQKQLDTYFSGRVGGFSRRDLLILATLLHDIAKADTLIQRKDGTTYCPAHELFGAAGVKKFAPRFALDAEALKHVERIVRNHGLPSQVLDLIIANNQRAKYLEFFTDTVGDIHIELILLMQADIMGSDLQKNAPQAYKERAEILSWMFDQTLSRAAKP